jgi:hypothetical protein
MYEQFRRGDRSSRRQVVAAMRVHYWDCPRVGQICALDRPEQKENTVIGQAQNPMGRGQWTRWGRGMCEGWTLEIGMAFRGSVVRRDSLEETTWIASINSTGLGEFIEREIAMRRLGELVESSMELMLHDWDLYQAAKSKR